jgi:membrane-bound metal-dependent hydrolase YbcI (DUF457 family)
MNKKGHVLNAILLSLGLGVILSVDPTTQPTVEAAKTTAETVAKMFLPVVLGALFPDVDTAFGRHRKTLHNLPVLALFLVYPIYLGNLYYVWIGVSTHYVLDIVGSKRGIALFYPLSDQEYDLPTGVATSSDWANPVTIAITAVELVALAGVHYYVIALDAGVQQAATMLGI